ncbi:hypothetical protein VCR15J2_20541 [Vibrio coralliirubri]|nr:hypothetical protein VCR15J2_20541 [Vibrio coralliirubri]
MMSARTKNAPIEDQQANHLIGAVYKDKSY